MIFQNLRNSFPDQSDADIEKLVHQFYSYLCDLILEVLKTLTISRKEESRRCIFHQPEWLQRFYTEGRSVVAVMGHYGNWEWAGANIKEQSGYDLLVAYRPLTNPYFEKMTHRMRTRFGTEIIPLHLVLRKMVEYKNRKTITTFIADQTAAPESAFWMNFLNQETAVHSGPEKIARKFNYPVVYARIVRIKRGYYEIFPELLTEFPNKTAENEISELFMQHLEKDILKDPVPWLWSHKRWKHVKPDKYK